MSERHHALYCLDILESGAAILDYVRDVTFDSFSRDRMRYAAVIREFEIIGEAVGKLPAELKAGLPAGSLAGYQGLQKPAGARVLRG